MIRMGKVYPLAILKSLGRTEFTYRGNMTGKELAKRLLSRSIEDLNEISQYDFVLGQVQGDFHDLHQLSLQPKGKDAVSEWSMGHSKREVKRDLCSQKQASEDTTMMLVFANGIINILHCLHLSLPNCRVPVAIEEGIELTLLFGSKGERA